MPETTTENIPYFDENNDLIIPFSCADHRFKYWKKEGMKLREILAELGANEATVNRYAPPESK